VQAEAITDDAVRQPLIDTVDELARLVDDTLDIARLGHTTEAPRLVDAAALIDAVVEEYKSHGAAVDFANAPRAVILCRTGLIRRLLRNVIDNALKYGGRAHLDLVEEGARLTLFVRDEGPGVAPDALERLTQPFVRLETSRNRSTGGSGLGLAIAQRIAETEGASLAFENGQGGGFVVAISWGPASVRPRQAQAS
jgi:signal transduction histidine kinase